MLLATCSTDSAAAAVVSRDFAEEQSRDYFNVGATHAGYANAACSTALRLLGSTTVVNASDRRPSTARRRRWSGALDVFDTARCEDRAPSPTGVHGASLR